MLCLLHNVGPFRFFWWSLKAIPLRFSAVNQKIAVLTNLGASEPQITRVWADEARERWTAYKSGKIPTVSYEEVMAKHRR